MKKLAFLALCLIFFSGFNPKSLTWVAIGDSITYLNDHPDETGNRISKGYLSLVQDKFPDLEVINKGYNGWTAVKIATEFEKLEIPKADVYSIFLGTNDWWGGRPVGTLQDYLGNTGVGTVHGAFRVIVDNLKSLNGQAKIILITPMQRVDFVYINDYKNNAYGSYREKNGQQLEQFANAIVSIANYEKFNVVDLYHKKGMGHADLVKFKRLKDPQTGEYLKYKYPDFIDINFDPKKDEYPYPAKSIKVTYDGLHPSDKGYRMIAKELYPIFREMLR
ncbi:SGNH/GDSL hydrolase family protein [Algoriphagus sp.]|uniref:SGNH/GDSL hydrolase family protein n=1 Tax=Algoriphagus sp. TaxID=1872435 RepID=UPI0027290677|nr:SGNH/GDSL hydrolase family protein [Algoriphagus sp.]MDO8965616.1 SGNH/GDSL hydrolase family protein [Algoriphagus sp.]MDP3200547.1 SGNH/GDSL hydrolase family protein [Algoriphagus sp.]